MRRRQIAIKITQDQWSFAVASGDGAGAKLLKTGTFIRDPERSLADQIVEAFEPLQMTDRFACSLPAQDSLLRWLEFPFVEPRKIAAAVPPEIACQIPESLDVRSVFHEIQQSGKVITAAVSKKQIEDLLEQFDDNREPLGYLGLAPFCFVAGLEWTADSLLLCVEGECISLARVEQGAVTDLRILPRATENADLEVIRQAQILSRCGTNSLQKVRLLGLASDSSLALCLKQNGFEIELVCLNIDDQQISEQLTTTASLALAACKASATGLNLRSGVYKLKNDWQALKRRAWMASGLVLLSLLIVSGSCYLQYQQRTSELVNIQQQMKSVYLKQFPGEKLRVAPLLQLQSKLKELQHKAAQFGTESPGALQVLLTVSKSIDTDLALDIREYVHSDEGLRLTGSTGSFDAVSRLLGALQKESLFKDVRILDSKQAIDGSRVDFQLQIQLSQTKGE